MARSVFKYSEELAQAVLKGTIPLEEAMRTVQQEKQKATGIEAQIARIRKAAPDLADQVADQTLTLGEAPMRARSELYPNWIHLLINRSSHARTERTLPVSLQYQ